MAKTKKKAKNFKVITPITKKSIGDISVCEIKTYETKDDVKLDEIVTYNVCRDIPTTNNLGTFTSYSYRRDEIKTGFNTLEEAITFAETI